MNRSSEQDELPENIRLALRSLVDQVIGDDLPPLRARFCDSSSFDQPSMPEPPIVAKPTSSNGVAAPGSKSGFWEMVETTSFALAALTITLVFCVFMINSWRAPNRKPTEVAERKPIPIIPNMPGKRNSPIETQFVSTDAPKPRQLEFEELDILDNETVIPTDYRRYRVGQVDMEQFSLVRWTFTTRIDEETGELVEIAVPKVAIVVRPVRSDHVFSSIP